MYPLPIHLQVIGVKNRFGGSKMLVQPKAAHNSLTACGPAKGPMVPPMFVFSGQRRTRDRIPGTKSAVWTLTESGWANESTFMAFLEHFLVHMKSQKLEKALLIVDGCHEHKFIPALEFALKNNITILCLPPATTAFMQPLDVGFFGPLQQNMVSIASDKNMIIGEDDLGHLCEAAYKKLEADDTAVGKSVLEEAFKATGIYPWDKTMVDQKGGFATADKLLDMTAKHPAVVAAKAATYPDMEVEVEACMTAIRPELKKKLADTTEAMTKAMGVDTSRLLLTSAQYLEGALKKLSDEKAEAEAKEVRKDERQQRKVERDAEKAKKRVEAQAKKAKRAEKKAIFDIAKLKKVQAKANRVQAKEVKLAAKLAKGGRGTAWKALAAKVHAAAGADTGAGAKGMTYNKPRMALKRRSGAARVEGEENVDMVL
jgi:hypothetical protein